MVLLNKCSFLVETNDRAIWVRQVCALNERDVRVSNFANLVSDAVVHNSSYSIGGKLQ